jgi:hypothetical protein
MLNKKSILYRTLARALSMKRPHGTRAVDEFTDWLFSRLPATAKNVFTDKAGNLHVEARTETTHKTLFVAHVDTVHRECGPNRIRKTQGTWYADGACLGADDGAGCAMLMHMLHKGVPGYYIFTQGEERGGIGAKHLADCHPELLSQFDRAIAFDRRGVDSVITHQGWGRCCSDEFAAVLSGELCADGVLMYLGDDTGVYTDTAEFVDLIPECTNISVGYNNEHSDRETLDIHHFKALAAAVVKINWDALPVERDPSYIEPVKPWQSVYGTTSWDGAWQDKFDAAAYADDELDRLSDAIFDAEKGMPHDLLEMVAEASYPEDPAMAMRFLNRRLLDDEVLAALRTRAIDSGHDVHGLLLELFDTLYCEA